MTAPTLDQQPARREIAGIPAHFYDTSPYPDRYRQIRQSAPVLGFNRQACKWLPHTEENRTAFRSILLSGPRRLCTVLTRRPGSPLLGFILMR